MHLSALDKARVFRRAYLAHVEDRPLAVLDVGSAVVDPTQRSNRDAVSNPRWTLTGLDIEPGPNVDVVVADPYDWREVPDGSVDVVTCSEVFEHAEYFWVTILEIARVLRPHGLAFITSPGSGPLHRFPVDCWRFYDDGLPAVARWGGFRVLEAQVQWAPVYRKGLQWRDASAVLQKPRLGEAEARAAALRGRLARLLAAPALDRAAVAAALAEPAAAPATASVIGERDGQDAFAARDAELARTVSPMRQKAHLLMRHLRDAGRILRTPLGSLRY